MLDSTNPAIPPARKCCRGCLRCEGFSLMAEINVANKDRGGDVKKMCVEADVTRSVTRDFSSGCNDAPKRSANRYERTYESTNISKRERCQAIPKTHKFPRTNQKVLIGICSVIERSLVRLVRTVYGGIVS